MLARGKPTVQAARSSKPVAGARSHSGLQADGAAAPALDHPPLLPHAQPRRRQPQRAAAVAAAAAARLQESSPRRGAAEAEEKGGALWCREGAQGATPGPAATGAMAACGQTPQYSCACPSALRDAALEDSTSIRPPARMHAHTPHKPGCQGAPPPPPPRRQQRPADQRAQVRRAARLGPAAAPSSGRSPCGPRRRPPWRGAPPAVQGRRARGRGAIGLPRHSEVLDRLRFQS
jgi:hypothetical protein